MNFTTIAYVAFFAIVFFAYYAIPRRFQWWLLLAGGLVFYSWISPFCLVFLFATMAITYVGAVGMDGSLQRQRAYIKNQGKALDREAKKFYKSGMERRRKWMLSGVILCLMAMLGTFKYGQFAINNFCALLGWIGIITMESQPSALNIILPIGLSFYIFQALGYCIDVFREEVPAERNFFRHALYVSFFPQVMQGPIGTYATLKPQLIAGHDFNYREVKFGLQRVAWGFFKKFMVANVIAGRINPCWTSVGDYHGSVCWTVILALYAIQLYADFSGYIDIACGCAQMLDVRLDENFDAPYLSKSIAEFWRRWHITLGAWFKNYVFYSILRTDWSDDLRKWFKGRGTYLSTAIPTTFALLIVWFAIGLWHGAAWSYIVYGLFHGSFIIAAVWLQPIYDRFHAAYPRLTGSRIYGSWQDVRTFAIVLLGYAIFRPADLDVTVAICRELLSGKVGSFDWLSADAWCVAFVWIALLVVVDIVHSNAPCGYIRNRISFWPAAARWTLYVTALVTLVLFGVYNVPELNQFAYFKF